MNNGALKVQIRIDGETAQILRPRMGHPKNTIVREQHYISQIKMRLGRLNRTIGKKKSSATSKVNYRNGRGTAIANVHRLSQRVIIKSRYLKMGSAKGKKLAMANLKYITRDSVGIDGGRAVAFNNETELNETELKLFVDRGADCPHQFRFIVSPENGDKLEMELFTKKFVDVMENDLATKLDYVAVVHYDTDNPHIHFVVNGQTDRGEELKINRNYLQNGMRMRAMEVATRELGYRREHEVQVSLEKEISAERFISLDQKLIKISELNKENPEIFIGERIYKEVDLSYLPKKITESFISNRGNLLGRLAELEKMELAYEAKPSVWNIDIDLRKKLQNLSRELDIIKAINAHIKDISDISEKVIIENTEPLKKEITGKVIGKGLVNELYDSRYMVVQGLDGNAYYSKLAAYSEKEGSLAKIGDFVTLDNKPQATAAEYYIANIAAKNDEIYSLEKHKELLETGKTKMPEGYKLEEYLDRYKGRMESLTIKGIAGVAGENAWNIPKDFIRRIENIELEPGKKLNMRVVLESNQSLKEQITARRMTLLDKHLVKGDYSLESSKTALGLEKEFREALGHRIEALNKLGLEINEALPKELNKLEHVDKIIDSHLKKAIEVKDRIIISDKIELASEVIGKVIGKGAIYKNYDTQYMVVQGTDNNIYYTPLAKFSEKIDMEAGIGDYVRLDNRTPKGAGQNNAALIAPEKLEKKPKLFTRVDLESTLPLAEQIEAQGLTLLDKQIAKNGYSLDIENKASGFERQFKGALLKRAEKLKEFGLAQEQGGKIKVNKDFGQELVEMEISSVVDKLAEKYGKYIPFDNIHPSSVSGEKERSFEGRLLTYSELPSGKMAVIRNSTGFTVIPMQSGMEAMIGKEIKIAVEKNVSVHRLNNNMQRARVRFAELDRDMSRGVGL